MNKIKAAILFITGVFTFNFLLVLPALAQFEGTVRYSSYEIKNGNQKESQDQFVMHVTPDRIMLQGENKYDFIGNIKTEGVLIRLDFAALRKFRNRAAFFDRFLESISMVVVDLAVVVAFVVAFAFVNVVVDLAVVVAVVAAVVAAVVVAFVVAFAFVNNFNAAI